MYIYSLRVVLVAACTLVCLNIAGAYHKDLGIDCDLQGGGSSICCAVLGDSAGSGYDDYYWQDIPNKGWFLINPTDTEYNDFHCNSSASGRATQWNTVTSDPPIPTLYGHGVSEGSCSGQF